MTVEIVYRFPAPVFRLVDRAATAIGDRATAYLTTVKADDDRDDTGNLA